MRVAFKTASFRLRNETSKNCSSLNGHLGPELSLCVQAATKSCFAPVEVSPSLSTAIPKNSKDERRESTELAKCLLTPVKVDVQGIRLSKILVFKLLLLYCSVSQTMGRGLAPGRGTMPAGLG